MPSTNDYYDKLKLQLDAAAVAKKAALDAQLERATNAQFGADGSITKQGTGTLDVNYQNQKRNIGTNAESSGTLRSGQYGRGLTENETDYRSRVTGAKATTIAAKDEVDTSTASQLAQYQAMYYTPPAKKTTPKKTTPKTTPKTGAGAGAGAGLGNKTTPLPIGANVFTPGRPVVPPKPKKPLTPVNSGKAPVTMSPAAVTAYQRAFGRKR
jgi:hypothetical protein